MNDLSFVVEPGELVALVGPSGGGKMHDNIGYGYEQAKTENIQKAAKMANAHGFIMDTQQGYDTDVGEKGSQMSGGQKQRIAIARALVREPVVLLLDEATSALVHPFFENLFKRPFRKNLKGRTVLLIAHRLSTVENADKIVVISGGRVAQIGVHKELINQEGIYKQLVQRQMLGGEMSEDVFPNDVPVIPLKGGGAKSRKIGSNSPSQTGTATSFLGSSIAGSYL
uniref:ABC transporter domain-containing protein n=1 Tax=Ditylenchus dipsaci TaxID=166011 RepID=A0A915E019_9BILA